MITYTPVKINSVNTTVKYILVYQHVNVNLLSSYQMINTPANVRDLYFLQNQFFVKMKIIIFYYNLVPLNCLDHELSCILNEQYFKSRVTSEPFSPVCLSLDMLCDGVKQCINGLDESNNTCAFIKGYSLIIMFSIVLY